MREGSCCGWSLFKRTTIINLSALLPSACSEVVPGPRARVRTPNTMNRLHSIIDALPAGALGATITFALLHFVAWLVRDALPFMFFGSHLMVWFGLALFFTWALERPYHEE